MRLLHYLITVLLTKCQHSLMLWCLSLEYKISKLHLIIQILIISLVLRWQKGKCRWSSLICMQQVYLLLLLAVFYLLFLYCSSKCSLQEKVLAPIPLVQFLVTLSCPHVSFFSSPSFPFSLSFLSSLCLPLRYSVFYSVWNWDLHHLKGDDS